MCEYDHSIVGNHPALSFKTKDAEMNKKDGLSVTQHEAKSKQQLKTHCCVFSSSPYNQPSFSSWMSRVMMSPSSKLRSVWLLPAVWGKMVLTRGFLLILRPDDWDVDRDRLPSPILPGSGGSREIRHVISYPSKLKSFM